MDRPTQMHANAVKRILRYVKGTIDFGIYYESNCDSGLCGLSDADYAGYSSCLISWCSAKKRSVTLSTTESEYVAAAEAMKELIWLKRLFKEIVPEDSRKPILYMDCQSAIKLVKNPEFHKRTKHIDVRYHFIREKYAEDEFDLKYVSTNEQNIFNNPLSKIKFGYFREKMNVLGST